MTIEREETLHPAEPPPSGDDTPAGLGGRPGDLASPGLEAPAGSVERRSILLPPGVAQVRLTLEVPENTALRVEVETRAAGGRLLGRRSLVFGAAALPGKPTLARFRLGTERLARLRAGSLATWLVWLALGLYAFTRLYALPSFPIYFFTDEAIQTTTAADLLRDHFYSPEHELLPTYFQNGSQYNLSASVYLQVLPYFFFGKSIWVTRGVAALMTLIAAACVGLILKNVFRSAYPWLAVMVLSITPVWFLHSRTAFETSLATSFYAAFLYFYLMYRTTNPRYLYPAIALGSLSFYAYSPMKMVMVASGLLLFLVDIRYHFRHWKTLLAGLGLGLLLALPFIRFLVNHPDATGWQMRVLGSYWITDIPLAEKLRAFGEEYLRGLDPLYWYLPNTYDLARHTMPGYGHLLRQTLPLGLLGVFLALYHVKKPAYRTLLIAVLAAPSGAALVRLGATRVLVMVIPMAILTALAIQAILDWLGRRWAAFRVALPRASLVLGIFILLAGINLYMLRDSLVNGPVWYSDYGLNGMQFGAQQLFGALRTYLRAHPDTHLIVSPSWANGTDVVARFFFPDPLPFQLGSPEDYFKEALPLDANTLFVMTPEEVAKIPREHFSEVNVEQTLPYPDGRAGFYFVRLKYVDNIAEVLADEEAALHRPLEAQVVLLDQRVKVIYPRLDIGTIKDLFDSRPDTLIRSAGINPFELGLDFTAPRPLSSLVLRVGGTATTVNIQVWREGQPVPYEIARSLPQAPDPRDVSFELPADARISRLQITVKNTNDPPDGFVHLWELSIR